MSQPPTPQQLMRTSMSPAMTPSSPRPHIPPPHPVVWTASMRRLPACSSWLSSGPRACLCSPTYLSGTRYTRRVPSGVSQLGHIPLCAGDDWRCMWLGEVMAGDARACEAGVIRAQSQGCDCWGGSHLWAEIVVGEPPGDHDDRDTQEPGI